MRYGAAKGFPKVSFLEEEGVVEKVKVEKVKWDKNEEREKEALLREYEEMQQEQMNLKVARPHT